MTDIEPVSRRSIVWARVMLWLLAIGVAAWAGLITRLVFFPSRPGAFHNAQILTPVVRPLGQSVASGVGAVKLSALLESSFDPGCLVSTQYFIEFSDGSMAKVPGVRLTSHGELKQAVYAAAVPLGAAPGPARFFIRDTYNCSVQAKRVETPRLGFVVLPSPAPHEPLPGDVDGVGD
jgi:hypothetical protein